MISQRNRKEYKFIDRSEWPPGPWDDEPLDKIQWIDEATGLDCMIKRGNPKMGNWCGYVGVRPDHPKVVEQGTDNLEVHGGVTFGGLCVEEDGETGICHIPEKGRPDKVFWVGFDCAHAWDVSPGMVNLSWMKDSVYRTQDYVVKEVEQLAQQLKEQ